MTNNMPEVNNNRIKRETQVKALVLSKLLLARRISTQTIIADEYPLTGTGVRADIALLHKSRFIGVEIKTEADTLRRLPRQLDVYRDNFDHTLLVIARKHFINFNSADYPDIEIWSIGQADQLTRISSPKTKVTQNKALSRLRLLTKSENKKYAEVTNPRERFSKAFSERYLSTTNRFWSSVQGNIMPENIKILSRLHEIRKQKIANDEILAKTIRAWGEFKNSR